MNGFEKGLVFSGGVVMAFAAGLTVRHVMADDYEYRGPVEFGVSSFDYSAAQNNAQVKAYETFVDKINVPKATQMMEDMLDQSDYEYQQYFPEVPVEVRSGTSDCELTDYSKLDNGQHLYSFDCVITPAETLGPTLHA